MNHTYHGYPQQEWNFEALNPSPRPLCPKKEPPSHAAHVYAADALGIEATLAHRLQLLSPKEFEGLLHPVSRLCFS